MTVIYILYTLRPDNNRHFNTTTAGLRLVRLRLPFTLNKQTEGGRQPSLYVYYIYIMSNPVILIQPRLAPMHVTVLWRWTVLCSGAENEARRRQTDRQTDRQTPEVLRTAQRSHRGRTQCMQYSSRRSVHWLTERERWVELKEAILH